MNDEENFDEIIAIIDQMEDDVSDEPKPSIFGRTLEDLFGGQIKIDFDKMRKREKQLMKKISQEYYQARLLDSTATQVHSFDFGTKMANYKAFEFLIREDVQLRDAPTRYHVEQLIIDMCNRLGYSVRLDYKR